MVAAWTTSIPAAGEDATTATPAISSEARPSLFLATASDIQAGAQGRAEGPHCCGIKEMMQPGITPANAPSLWLGGGWRTRDQRDDAIQSELPTRHLFGWEGLGRGAAHS